MNKESFRKIINPWLVLTHMCRYFPFKYLPDKFCLKIFYKAYLGRFPDFKNPMTYNEKLQWLKLYDRNPLYTDLSDKYLVREYVSKKIGEKYLIPLLGVWDRVEDIDYDSLPDQFVLKCNHDSGSVVICKDKASFDVASANKKIKRCLRTQFYWKGREYNYKNINRKIVAEQYMQNEGADELTDYKFFCFDGEPKFIQVDRGRFIDHIRNFYDADWNFIDVQYGCKNDNVTLDAKPVNYDEMLSLAKILSKDFVHVRVDFYNANNKVYFGELTFHHGGGFMSIKPEKYDAVWGDYLNLDSIVKRNS